MPCLNIGMFVSSRIHLNRCKITIENDVCIHLLILYWFCLKVWFCKIFVKWSTKLAVFVLGSFCRNLRAGWLYHRIFCLGLVKKFFHIDQITFPIINNGLIFKRWNHNLLILWGGGHACWGPVKWFCWCLQSQTPTVWKKFP